MPLDHDVFISYSAKDKAIADAVCFALESRKIRCWIAPRDVRAGIPYAEALLEALDGCRVMVLLLSSNSNTSPQVMREVERAASKGAYIIPVRIEDIALSPSLQFFIGPIQWIDAMTPPLEKHLEYLGETVGYVLGRVAKGRPPVTEKGILPEPDPAQLVTPPGPAPAPTASPTPALEVTQAVSGAAAPPKGLEAPPRVESPPRVEVPRSAEVPQATPRAPVTQKPRARISTLLIVVGVILGVSLIASAGTGAYFVIKSLREGRQAAVPNRPPEQTPPTKPPAESPVVPPPQPAPNPPVVPPVPPQPVVNPPAVPPVKPAPAVPATPPAAPPAAPAKPLTKPPAVPPQPAPKPPAAVLPVPSQMKLASTSSTRVAAGGNVTFDFTFVLDAKESVPAEDTVAWRTPDSQLHYGTYGRFTALPGLNARRLVFNVGSSRPPGTEFPVFGIVRIGGKLYKTQVPVIVSVVGGLVDQVRLVPTSPTMVPAGGKVNFDLTFVLEANQSMAAEWNYALRSPNGTLSYMTYLSFTASPGTNTVHTTLTVGPSQPPGSVLSLLGVIRINGTLYQGQVPVLVRVAGGLAPGASVPGALQVDRMTLVPTSPTQVPAGEKVFFNLTFFLAATGPVAAEDSVAVRFPDGRLTYLPYVSFSASPGMNTRRVWYSPGSFPPGTTVHIDWVIRVNGRVYQTQESIPITVLPR